MTNKITHPLFHPKTLNNAIRNFTFPQDLDQRHALVKKWLEPLKAGTLNEIKEVSLHGEFLTDIFQRVLGYVSVISGGGKAWEIHAETTISDGGGSADAALGFFTASAGKKDKIKLEGKVIAPIELKGAKEDLDRPPSGRKESAVEQGWRYANYTPDCRWVIVSNYRELRLYYTSKTPAYYERFRLVDLEDIQEFKRFYFIFCRQNFLGVKSDRPSAIDRLLAESNEVQESITKQLYQEYKEIRGQLVKHFRFSGPKDLPDRDRLLIEKAQKTLDRILFIAFCEDKGLLPAKTIMQAHDHQDPYNPRPIWENYKAVFRWVDKGNENPPISGYNGGLFEVDPLLDEQLTVPNILCGQIKQLTRYDFDTEVSVDILGRIFEQSVTDLEELKAEATGQEYNQKKGKRKTQGVFYTPAFITQYIVEVALGGYLKKQEQEIRDRLQLEQISPRATKKRQQAEIQFWETYRDEVLKQTRVIDPACGSGAFLIAAFEYLLREYERVNQALASLEIGGKKDAEIVGQRSLFDLNRTILNQNLYGVDLSPESVEITKLSLWLKTAEKGKTLTDLDGNIKVGNSLVDDPEVAERAFNWQAEFPEVFADGGFDVAIGNPPYVRQELLSPIKPYLQKKYQSYDGVADLYAYFYEQGLNILKPGGVLSYIVTNKWLRAGYGEALRRFFVENSVFEEIVDFGHAPIFEDADTFPCIVGLRKRLDPQGSGEKYVQVCPVPREKLADINLTQYVQQESYPVAWSRFSADAWSLERPEVEALMEKILRVGIPLKEFAGVKPYRGILTGFNEAFLIDETTKNRLVKADPKSAEVIKPFLRGRDIKRWSPDWQNLWLIFTKRGIDIDAYPAVKAHLSQYRKKLEPRPKDWHTNQDGEWLGRKTGSYQWYEIQDAVDYWQMFEQPKIIYQEINTFPAYAIDTQGYFANNKVFLIAKYELYLCGCLNSALGWWIAHQIFPKMIGDAVTPRGDIMVDFPIAPPTAQIREQVEPIVSRLIEITQANQTAYKEVLDWLQVEQKIDKPGEKLEEFANLEENDFIQEVKKRQPKSSGGMSPSALKELRQVYQDYAPDIQARQAEALTLEYRLADLVNQAYGLTPEEIDLMWKTAPPRMPIAPEK
ncbi:Eco57I restriction-modification methylase domain-containing protein [Planktothricoides raciborskii]|uniref:site-specific DNA-methyltransferase (adenine-specific) n=1 Tax=Planktothricoides raciborskii FACHB-1370 TaxID=2949576 RepID=A0ABR8EHE0_9CYAN|nr:DNA methyltransferase [Planktothricoides raciborskii]MBD2546266.1 Eco57I restriction-modification methylase domain-containing protein [Planktothricoides raciborskii FACHB-1370]MBD2584173.1 Eco57I restriction-modification methylase domain-containing protein [Planktothricoides raciborskii FACHB-1261]